MQKTPEEMLGRGSERTIETKGKFPVLLGELDHLPFLLLAHKKPVPSLNVTSTTEANRSGSGWMMHFRETQIVMLR